MASNSEPVDIFSKKVDRKWAGGGRQYDDRPSSYYDYFFSGEDVKVYIDGLFDPKDELDIASFAYSIRQEKAPVYGFWSYNYDAVLYGTRIISGEFTLYTKSPRRMTTLLEKAAYNRSSKKNKSKLGRNSIVSRMTAQNHTAEDELNMEKYWSMSQLDRITSDPATDQVDTNNIFSAHPPFNFIILYGVEETAVSPREVAHGDIRKIKDNLDRINVLDVNERNVKIDDIDGPMKIVLQQVNLISMGTAYTPGGQAVMESYQFMARDFYFTEVDMSFIKSIPVVNLSDYYYSLADFGASINPTSTSYNYPLGL